VASYATSQRTDARWWREPEGEAHRTLVANAMLLLEKSSARHELDRRHMRLYGGAEYAGLSPGQYSSILPFSERVAWNVIASVIDTYVAKMLRSTPAPMFLTNAGDFKSRRKAQKLNTFAKGALYQSGANRLRPTIERDAAIFGTGILHVYGADDKRLCAERVFPWELLVDNVEAMYGEPRTLYRRKFVDRAVLLELFGGDEETKKAIRDAKEASKNEIGRDTLADQVEVWEAWRLPSGTDANDGRHVIAIDCATLLDEEWTRARFPFAVRRYADPVIGFWGQGIAERLTGIQLEINKLLLRIQKAHHMLGRPLVILDEVSGIPESHITNEVAAILVKNGGGNPIQVETSPTMPSDVYQHLMTLRGQAFEEIGVSQLDATSRKPAGLDSGAALREYNDIGSERFLPQGKRAEDWVIDVTRVCLDEARELGGLTVDAPDKRGAKRIAWKDVSLEDEAYILQCYPTSALPQQPAARLQKVQELISTGFIPREQALDLIEFPDLDGYRDQQTAAIDAVRSRIDAILDGEEYIAPEAFDNPQLIMALALPVYLRERETGAPEDILEELRRYLNEAGALVQMAQQPAGPAAAADPAALAAVPQGAPVALPPDAAAMPPMAA
jgi:hypothetical protein